MLGFVHVWEESSENTNAVQRISVGGEVRATGVTAHGCVTTEGRPTRVPTWLRDLA